MFLSIITVVKNNASGLRMTGRSLMVQMGAPEFEWIIIDGASTDNTMDVMIEFADLNPKIISESDAGIYAAMNKGIEASSGEYLWFLNGGDCLPDGYTLRDVRSEIRSAFKPDFMYGDARENGRTKEAHDFDQLKRGQVTHHQAMIYARKAIGDIRFNPDYKIAADYAFTLDVAGRTTRVHYMDRILCDFQSGGVSQTSAALGREENYRIRKDILQMPDWLNKYYLMRDNLAQSLRQALPTVFWMLRASNKRYGRNNGNVRARNENLTRRLKLPGGKYNNR